MSRDPGLEREHFDDWRRQIGRHAGDASGFLSYFDTAASVEEAFAQGAWDFSCNILRQPVPSLLGEPFEATALEIGFGAGRLAAAASRHFARVIGVDIHEDFDRARALLDERGIANVDLVRGDGRTLPVDSASVDFVYSFIVLQHLPLLETLESYLAEVRRVLKPGQPAILYFGHLPFNRRLKAYEDLSTRGVDSSRENTLLLRPSFSRRLLRTAGLEVVATGRSTKKPWRADPGAQHYAVVTA